MQDEYKHQEFPKWMYGPSGESAIFESEADIPEGWKDHPNKFSKKTKKSESQNDAVADTPPTEAPEVSPANEEATAPVKASESTDSAEANVTPELTKKYLNSRSMSQLWKMAGELDLDKGGKKPELVERIFNALEEAKKK